MAKTFLNTKITELAIGVHEIDGVKRKTVLTNDLFLTLDEQGSYGEWLTSIINTIWFHDLKEGENYIQVEEDLFAFTLPTVRAYFNFFSISDKGVKILLKLMAAKSFNGAPSLAEA